MRPTPGNGRGGVPTSKIIHALEREKDGHILQLAAEAEAKEARAKQIQFAREMQVEAQKVPMNPPPGYALLFQLEDDGTRKDGKITSLYAFSASLHTSGCILFDAGCFVRGAMEIAGGRMFTARLPQRFCMVARDEVKHAALVDLEGWMTLTPEMVGEFTAFWDAHPDLKYDDLVQAFHESRKDQPSDTSASTESGTPAT